MHTHTCPKCGSRDILRIPDNPGRYASGNNIYTSSLTLAGKVPVIRCVCLGCGCVENWVEAPEQLKKLRRTLVGAKSAVFGTPCGRGHSERRYLAPPPPHTTRSAGLVRGPSGRRGTAGDS